MSTTRRDFIRNSAIATAAAAAGLPAPGMEAPTSSPKAT